MFSIIKKKKYEINQTRVDRAICSILNQCLNFTHVLALRNNFMSNDNNWVQLYDCGVGESLYEINNDEHNFIVKQLFVYQISY